MQGKDTMNKNQSLTCRRWFHAPLLFLHKFLRFVLLLLLHNSGKLAISHDSLFFILQIMHLVLFKLLYNKGELSIFGRADLLFVRNRFVAINFWPSVSKSCLPRAETMQQGLHSYRWQVETLCWYMALYGCFLCLGRY